MLTDTRHDDPGDATTPLTLEQQAQMYWSVSKRFHEAVPSDVPDREIERLLEELEGVLLHSESALVQERCKALLDGELYERQTA